MDLGEPRSIGMYGSMARRLFDAIDTDKSGYIDIHELQAALLKLDIEADEETIADIINLIDTNNDGVVNFEEFSRFLYICQKADDDDPKKVLFFAADRDLSGTIDREELHELLNRIGLRLTKAEFETTVGEIIGNQNIVDYSSFLKLVNSICM